MVPEGWAVVPLGEIVKISSGGTPSKSDPELWDGSHPWLSARDLKKPTVSDSELHLSEAGWKKASKAPANSVLLLVRGMTLFKDVPISLTTREVAFNQDIKCLAPNSDVNPSFLAYYLIADKPRIRSYVDTAGHGTGRLATDALLSHPIYLPPINEQELIARIVTTWHNAIETVERLITNSDRQKQALMRSLLHQISSHHVAHDSHTYRLADVAEVIVSNVDKKSLPNEDPVRLCNYTDVYYNDYITSNIPFMGATATKSQIQKFSLRKGDILITKDSETPDDIAVPSLVDEDLEDVVCGYHLAIIRPKEGVDGAYLRSLFSLGATQHYFFTRANGATRFGLTIDAIKNAIFTLPSLEKQREVAKIIRSAETLEYTYEADLKRLRQEKQALMQQLLTGKRRVRVDDAVESAYA